MVFDSGDEINLLKVNVCFEKLNKFVIKQGIWVDNLLSIWTSFDWF